MNFRASVKGHHHYLKLTLHFFVSFIFGEMLGLTSNILQNIWNIFTTAFYYFGNNKPQWQTGKNNIVLTQSVSESKNKKNPFQYKKKNHFLLI